MRDTHAATALPLEGDDAGARGTVHAPSLALEGVSFAYPGAREPIVRAVSLRLAAGEMVGLLGPNGAGKSTLLRLAAGALRPAAGRVTLDGRDLRTLRRGEIARRVAVVPQDFSAQFAYTVRQIVELGRTPHTGAWQVARAGDHAAVEDALAITNLEPLADRVFNELSGGERQRTLIALALAQQAAIALLDEPTAHLDIRHQIETLELLRRLNRTRGLTVLAALHDLNLAARYFPRLVVFRREIIADGAPTQALDRALLAAVYETPVHVGILPGEASLSVLPPMMERVDERDAPLPASRRSDAPVHVVAGGGTGALLMRALADAGVAFTAGPLAIGDGDTALAQRLALRVLTTPPAEPLAEASLRVARDAMGSATGALLCPFPLSAGNLALLELAAEAQRSGARILLYEPELAPDAAPPDALLAAVRARDYTGTPERAAALYRTLLAAGARVARTPAEAVGGVE